MSGPPRNPLPPPASRGALPRGFDLGGRRAIVYGAESPLGGALCAALREAGATVGVTSAGTDGNALFALKKAAAGGPSAAVDLTNATNVRVATRKLSKELGGLEIAVVVPTVYFAAPIGKTDAVALERTLAGALGAAYNVFRSAAREIAGKAEEGRLLAVLSGVALRGLANTSALAASQAAVVGLVRALAQELGPAGVTSNAIVSGWRVDSPGRGPADPNDNPLQRQIPLRRFGRPDEIAPLAVYLCSPASGYVNGQVIAVDGGILQRV